MARLTIMQEISIEDPALVSNTLDTFEFSNEFEKFALSLAAIF